MSENIITHKRYTARVTYKKRYLIQAVILEENNVGLHDLIVIEKQETVEKRSQASAGYYHALLEFALEYVRAEHDPSMTKGELHETLKMEYSGKYSEYQGLFGREWEVLNDFSTSFASKHEMSKYITWCKFYLLRWGVPVELFEEKDR